MTICPKKSIEIMEFGFLYIDKMKKNPIGLIMNHRTRIFQGIKVRACRQRRHIFFVHLSLKITSNTQNCNNKVNFILSISDKFHIPSALTPKHSYKILVVQQPLQLLRSDLLNNRFLGSSLDIIPFP